MQWSTKSVLLTLICAPLLTGCSQDKIVIDSTVFYPASVAIVDPGRKLTIWQMDVPVDHKLVLDFDRPLELEFLNANMKPATKMSWRLYLSGRGAPVEKDRIDLPGTPIIVRETYRPAPEYPPHPTAVPTVDAAPAAPETGPTPGSQTTPTTDATSPATDAVSPAPEPTATEPTTATAESEPGEVAETSPAVEPSTEEPSTEEPSSQSSVDSEED